MSNLINIELTNDALSKMQSLGIEREDLEREWMYAQRHFISNPKLESADHNSVVFSILDALAIGITLNPVNQYAYLEPRWNKAQKKNLCHFQPMFRGLAYLAIKEGAATSFNCQVVHENDDFRATPSDPINPVQHQVAGFKRGPVVGVYVIAYLPDGRALIELIDREESDRILKTSQSPAAKLYPNEFRRKTALKRIIKRIAFGASDSPLMTAMNIDNQNHEVVEVKEDKPASLPEVKEGSETWRKCVNALCQGYDMDKLREHYVISTNQAEAMEKESVVRLSTAEAQAEAKKELSHA